MAIGARDSAVYALAFVERILAAAERVVEFPRSGRPVPEADDTTIRAVLCQSFRIIYRIRDGGDSAQRIRTATAGAPQVRLLTGG